MTHLCTSPRDGRAEDGTYLLRILVGVMFASLLIAIPFALERADEIGLAGLAILALAIVATPLYLWRRYSVFEPMTFIILMTFVGISWKVVYILAFEGERELVDRYLLRGQTPGILLFGTGLICVGLAFFLFGYWPRRKNLSLSYLLLTPFSDWSGTRLRVVSLVIMIVATLSFAMFVRGTGARFNSLSDLSQKRFNSADSGGQGDGLREGRLQTSTYYFYRIASFSRFVFYLNLAWLVHRKKRLLSQAGLFVAWPALQSLLLALFLNSRGALVLLLFDGLIITYCLKDRIDLRKIVLAGSLGATLIVVQLAARVQNDHSPVDLLEKTVSGRDFMDVSKTSHIVNAIPSQIDYCYGETMFGWLAAPIPRSVWPGKPLWAERGVYINRKVFGAKNTSGVTLGLVAEFYWNFGLVGVCAGMYFYGVFLRLLWHSFQAASKNPTVVVVYAIAVSRLTLTGLGSDVGTGILKTALDIVPLAAIIFLVQQRVYLFQSPFPNGLATHRSTSAVSQESDQPLPLGQH